MFFVEETFFQPDVIVNLNFPSYHVNLQDVLIIIIEMTYNNFITTPR